MFSKTWMRLDISLCFGLVYRAENSTTILIIFNESQMILRTNNLDSRVHHIALAVETSPICKTQFQKSSHDMEKMVDVFTFI